MAWGRAGRPCRRGFITRHDAYTHTQRCLELRACNSQPSEPFIYWGLKIYKSTFNGISLCKIKMQPQKKGVQECYGGRAMSCP